VIPGRCVLMTISLQALPLQLIDGEVSVQAKDSGGRRGVEGRDGSENAGTNLHSRPPGTHTCNTNNGIHHKYKGVFRTCFFICVMQTKTKQKMSTRTHTQRERERERDTGVCASLHVVCLLSICICCRFPCFVSPVSFLRSVCFFVAHKY